MTASTSLKNVLAGIAAVAVMGTAIAQGTPPTTSSADPATGAGQRSTQNTPMGSTGTPGANAGGNAGATGAGATGAGSTNMNSSNNNSGMQGSTAGSARTNDTTGTQGSNMGSTRTNDSTTMAQNTRPARADRN